MSSYANDFLSNLYEREKASVQERETRNITVFDEFRATSTPVGSSTFEEIVSDDVYLSKMTPAIGFSPKPKGVQRTVLADVTNTANSNKKVVFSNQKDLIPVVIPLELLPKHISTNSSLPSNKVGIQDSPTFLKNKSYLLQNISQLKKKSRSLQPHRTGSTKLNKQISKNSILKPKSVPPTSGRIESFEIEKKPTFKQMPKKKKTKTFPNESEIEAVVPEKTGRSLCPSRRIRKRKASASSSEVSVTSENQTNKVHSPPPKSEPKISRKNSVSPKFKYSQRKQKLTYSQLLGLCCKARDPLSLVRFKQAAN